jgi:Ser/Thr protein kinase RdoA (MazF antagonist)
MDPTIGERYSDLILTEACERLGVDQENTELLGGFESFVYRTPEAILRISHSIHRSRAQILSELDYLEFLAGAGVSVAPPVHGPSGATVVTVDDQHGGQFTAALFCPAPGGLLWDTGGWNNELLTTYGRLVGRMHRVSRDYVACDGIEPRPGWEAQMRNAEEDQEINVKLLAAIASIHEIDRDKGTYHMIHQDPHLGNFHVDEQGKIVLFDFDDCAHGHAAYDLAMTVFYEYAPFPTGSEQIHAYWAPLLEGYLGENAISKDHLATIPRFLKLREIELYHTIRTEIPENEWNENAWVQAFMTGRRTRILNDQPVIDYDFGAW